MKYNRFFTAVLALVTTVAVARPAYARKSVATARKTGGLDLALGGLRWGATPSQVLDHFEKARWKEYRETKKGLADPLEIDRLRARIQRHIERAKTRYVRFTKDSSDYRVSIIDQDFARGTGEAVLRVDREDAQTYWFFIQEQLWKLVVAYNATAIAGKDLPTLARGLRAQYGKPIDRGISGPTGEYLLSVKWLDESTELVLRDRLDPYGTFALTYTSREHTGRLDELRGKLTAFATAADAASAATDSMIDDIMAAPEVDDEADIVDELLGLAAPEKPDALKAQVRKTDDPNKALEDALGADKKGKDGEIIY